MSKLSTLANHTMDKRKVFVSNSNHKVTSNTHFEPYKWKRETSPDCGFQNESKLLSVALQKVKTAGGNLAQIAIKRKDNDFPGSKNAEVSIIFQNLS